VDKSQAIVASLCSIYSRDTKPDNMLMGDGKQGNKVYMTNIGLAKQYERPIRPVGCLI
jgi:hypothetical protein